MKSLQKQITNRMQKKQNNFGVKYGNEKTMTAMVNGSIAWKN